MAGVIKVDRVQSDSNLAFNIASSNVAFIDSTGMRIVGNNFSVSGTSLLTSGRVPSTVMPAGSVIQVLQTVKSDAFSGSAGSFLAITGLSVTITPTSSTSKFLVFAQITTTDSNNYPPYFHLYRNGVQCTPNGQSTGYTPGYAYSMMSGGAATGATGYATIPLMYLDSPATGSAVTYQIYGAKPSVAASGLYVNPSTGGSSSITVMEIAV